MLVWMIKEEGVRVFIVDVVNEGDKLQFGPWASPPLRIASADTVILVVLVVVVL
jgi:hypothetical protein